jgi:hypothetical protein
MSWISEKSWFDSWQRIRDFFFSKMPKLVLEPTQPAVQ